MVQGILHFFLPPQKSLKKLLPPNDNISEDNFIVGLKDIIINKRSYGANKITASVKKSLIQCLNHFCTISLYM